MPVILGPVILGPVILGYALLVSNSAIARAHARAHAGASRLFEWVFALLFCIADFRILMMRLTS